MECRFSRPAGRIMACLFLVLAAFASASFALETGREPVLLHAARVFDGDAFRVDASVLVADGRVARIGARGSFEAGDAKVIDLGDATLLPGFIELHAHLTFRNVPADIVLRHGITTIRDVGGPVHPPYGGDGSLRVLTSGPILTAPGGYPIPSLGEAGIATAVSTEQEARAAVRSLIEAGAVVIKVALEPGGEAGAPWSSGHGHDHGHGHGHGHSHQADADHEISGQAPPAGTSHHAGVARPRQAWPLLPETIVRAIADEAHKNNRKVTAHIAEAAGAHIALNAGVDEWAHVPCDSIPASLLKKAAAQNVTVITTLDTLSGCSGVAHNAATLAALGTRFLYGAEIAHPDIPWGIDAQELAYMMSMARMELVDVLRAATSRAGRHLGLSPLGSLQPGAPADLIAVRGDPARTLKILEYPDLVMSGGTIVVNNFERRPPVSR